MHVLIIEDNALVAGLIKDCLKDIGYASFDFAVSEAEAVAAALRTWPDLIVADDQLISGTGTGAVTAIRQIGAVPVVFASAEPEHLLVANPDAIVLTKPFLIDGFTNAVRSAVKLIAP